MNFSPYFPHMLSDLGETQYKRQAHILLRDAFKCWKAACNEGLTFLTYTQEITYMDVPWNFISYGARKERLGTFHVPHRGFKDLQYFYIRDGIRLLYGMKYQSSGAGNRRPEFIVHLSVYLLPICMQ
jgi:hypothetical protein